MKNFYCLVFTIILLISCNQKENSTSTIKTVAAMKDVMWKGELQGKINLDTISDKMGLFGLGPVSGLTGEILINDGTVYTSKVTSDSTMIVEKNKQVEAPFFVYGNVTNWQEIALPKKVNDLNTLEKFIDETKADAKKPFIFKLKGMVDAAKIHIQNLAKGTKVSSPKEAHQGQVTYDLENEEVEIIGFFSRKHQGIFTHHDSFAHMHLITSDEKKMGHLDAAQFNQLKLYIEK
ncbi:acetolactate decarboxylase [Mesonia mobilis]|uniref:acetolactate decarboxylase n=1 Tax=Mesonia mobilis TaxID=369791 RepID=UPI0026E96628|nr:acetolactate decarboxylase [Mesonia mobilis]